MTRGGGVHIHVPMNDHGQMERTTGIGRELSRKRRDILAMEPEAALDAILDAPRPGPLVRSFTEQDFFLLIQEIGESDALELLSLASFRQWEHILDIEAWDRDRLDVQPLTRWLSLLMMANPARLVEWFLTDETELIEFYMFRNMDVFVRQHDQDPSDFGDGLFTLDDTFYIDFREDVGFDDEEARSLRDAFLTRFLEKLAEYDYPTYHRVMLEYGTFIPAEYEEEAYRRRNVRLAEKGFLPFEEAVSIYRPLKAKDLKAGGAKIIVKGDEGDGDLPAPIFPAVNMGADTPFTRALGTIGTEDVLEGLQAEFAGLSNRIVTADGITVRSREALRAVVEKACGYISIGLESLTTPADRRAVDVMAVLIKKYPLSRLFRVGYGKALALKWRARRWRKGAWFGKKGLPLSFWDEAWMGVVGGLLLEKPLFFDNYRTGVIYREFASLADIRSTRTSLDAVIALDDLLGRMDLPVVKNRFITYKRLFLTLWARNWLDLPQEMAPIGLDRFKTFFNALWTPGGAERRIRDDMKADFLGWAAEKSGKEKADIADRLGTVLTDLFASIASEYGAVAGSDLDPRWIHLFWVSRDPAADEPITQKENENAHI